MSLAGLGLLVATVYPMGAERWLASAGTRPVAGVLLGVGLASLLLWRSVAKETPAPWALRLGLLSLPLLALATGDALYLRLVPVAIQFLIGAYFLLSLSGGSSILQETAKRIHPYAPEFIGPYCRKVTVVFAVFFALQGLAVAWIAFDPPASGWGFASGILAWAPVMAATVVEWGVRKSYFRYYGDGPLDRLLARLWPAEATEAGRRSLDYVRRTRAELGMPPP